METVNFDDVITEFKTVAEVRALIVLNGLNRETTLADYMKAIVHCAVTDPFIGPADCADWRLFTVEVGGDVNNVHLPNWLVDCALQFVTDDELDTLLGDTPIENWITGLADKARTVPPIYHNERTVTLCQYIEEAGATVPADDKAKVQKAVTDKVARVKAQKAAIASGEALPESTRDIRVAIIGL